ncbi:hypothetical protein [Streptomyces sp. MNP-20]|uniref:hypothetical protein n=1 Tax=Streptomyces sp. MNP-20 TaxID=2721165 RepID=UPI0020A64BA0|nr:hypothetical protein [Streptomyces sp. MNP-20]
MNTWMDRRRQDYRRQPERFGGRSGGKRKERREADRLQQEAQRNAVGTGEAGMSASRALLLMLYLQGMGVGRADAVDVGRWRQLLRGGSGGAVGGSVVGQAVQRTGPAALAGGLALGVGGRGPARLPAVSRPVGGGESGQARGRRSIGGKVVHGLAQSLSDTSVWGVPDDWGITASSGPEVRAMEAAKFLRGVAASNLTPAAQADAPEQVKKAAQLLADAVGYLGVDDRLGNIADTVREFRGRKASFSELKKMVTADPGNYLQIMAILLDGMASRQRALKDLDIEVGDSYADLVGKGMDRRLLEAGVGANAIPGLPWAERQSVRRFGELSAHVFSVTDELNRRMFSHDNAYRVRQLLALAERIPEDLKRFLVEERNDFDVVFAKVTRLRLVLAAARENRLSALKVDGGANGLMPGPVAVWKGLWNGGVELSETALNSLAWAFSWDALWAGVEVSDSDIHSMTGAIRVAHAHDTLGRKEVDRFLRDRVRATRRPTASVTSVTPSSLRSSRPPSTGPGPQSVTRSVRLEQGPSGRGGTVTLGSGLSFAASAEPGDWIIMAGEQEAGLLYREEDAAGYSVIYNAEEAPGLHLEVDYSDKGDDLSTVVLHRQRPRLDLPVGFRMATIRVTKTS